MSLPSTFPTSASTSLPLPSLSPTLSLPTMSSPTESDPSTSTLTTTPTSDTTPPPSTPTPTPTESPSPTPTETSDTTDTTDTTPTATSDTSTTSTTSDTTTTSQTTQTSETSTSESPTSSDTSTTTSAPESTIVSTIVITSNGQASTQFITSELPASTSGSSSTDDGGGSSNTGAIVGGVVGGIAALAALVLLIWFCLRRRKRDEFDGDFDPDAVAKRNSSTMPRLGRAGDADLLAAARGVENEPEVTPYTYGMQQHPGSGGASFLGPAGAAGAGAAAGYAAGAYDRKGSQPPSAYHDPNAPVGMPSGPSEAGSSGGERRTSLSSGGVPYGASPYPPAEGPVAYGMYTPGPVPGAGTPSSPTTQSHSTYSTYPPSSAKEREAFAQRYAVQNGQGQGALYGDAGANAPGVGGPVSMPVPIPASLQPGGGAAQGQAPGLVARNASPTDEEAPSVVVHQDGGRVREEDVPNEIPPTYDSIRPDDDDGNRR